MPTVNAYNSHPHWGVIIKSLPCVAVLNNYFQLRFILLQLQLQLPLFGKIMLIAEEPGILCAKVK
jgi:hypothetical protein